MSVEWAEVKITGRVCDYLIRYPRDGVLRALTAVARAMSEHVASGSVRVIVDLRKDNRDVQQAADVVFDYPLPDGVLQGPVADVMSFCREGWMNPELI